MSAVFKAVVCAALDHSHPPVSPAQANQLAALSEETAQLKMELEEARQREYKLEEERRRGDQEAAIAREQAAAAEARVKLAAEAEAAMVRNPSTLYLSKSVESHIRAGCFSCFSCSSCSRRTGISACHTKCEGPRVVRSRDQSCWLLCLIYFQQCRWGGYVGERFAPYQAVVDAIAKWMKELDPEMTDAEASIVAATVCHGIDRDGDGELT